MFPSVSQIIVSTWNLFCFLVFFFPNYENEHGFYPFCLFFFFIGGDPKSVEWNTALPYCSELHKFWKG